MVVEKVTKSPPLLSQSGPLQAEAPTPARDNPQRGPGALHRVIHRLCTGLCTGHSDGERGACGSRLRPRLRPSIAMPLPHYSNRLCE